MGPRILYRKRSFNVNEHVLGMVLRGRYGSGNLVAIANMVTFKYSSVYGAPGPVTEESLKSILHDTLRYRISEVGDISDAHVAALTNVLDHIRTAFTLQPRLSGHLDFVNNNSYRLCCALDLPLLHGWVLSSQATGYDSLCELSCDELLQRSLDLKCQDVDATVKALLSDSNNQLTSHGFQSLAAELNDDAVALLFCRNKLEIIHKHNGALFLFVTDEDTLKLMPEAAWILFEESQESSIYFNQNYAPVKGQPCEDKAREWYRSFIQAPNKDINAGKPETRNEGKNAARNRWKKRQEEEE